MNTAFTFDNMFLQCEAVVGGRRDLNFTIAGVALGLGKSACLAYKRAVYKSPAGYARPILSVSLFRITTSILLRNPNRVATHDLGN